MLLLQVQSIADALNSSEWVFPIAECFHIAAFAWSAPWTILGLAVVLLSGPVLFLSDVNMYLHNASFRFKMYALALAIIFNFTFHWKIAKSDTSTQPVRTVTAIVSLALWISVVFGGLFIAFV